MPRATPSPTPTPAARCWTVVPNAEWAAPRNAIRSTPAPTTAAARARPTSTPASPLPRPRTSPEDPSPPAARTSRSTPAAIRCTRSCPSWGEGTSVLAGSAGLVGTIAAWGTNLAGTGLTGGKLALACAAGLSQCQAAALGPGCAGQSFTAGTEVLLADGKAAPIAALKPGDKILATNLKTGKTQPEPVAAVLVHYDTDLYDLKVRVHGRTAVIDTTRNHPFWVPYLDQWIASNKLAKGERLLTANGTVTVVVGGTTPKVHDGWMWDLTVTGNGDHDFYVGATVAPVLVHNCDTFEAPDITVNRHGQLTNGRYTLDSAGMDPHVNGTPGKSQFSFYINSGKAVLDAAAYADEYHLWVGNKAKVPVANGIIGSLGDGTPTSWINVYRTATGYVHGSLGGAP